jgi:DNA-binding response OmpR family regulator
MKTIDKLKPVPVVILTGDPIEIARAHAADVAADYIVKPIEVKRFRDILDHLGFTT